METGQQLLSVVKIRGAVEGDAAELEAIGGRGVPAPGAAHGGSKSSFSNAADRGLADILRPPIGIAEMADVEAQALLHVLSRA